LHDFLISGDILGQSANECWLGFFPYSGDSNIWYLGTLFMQTHYVVFDLTPYTARGEDTLQIGLALPNTDNPLLSS